MKDKAPAYKLKTPNLFIRLYTREDLRNLISKEEDQERKTLFEGMLNNCENDTKNGQWYTYWEILLRDRTKIVRNVGFAFFNGPAVRGEVELNLFIEPRDRDKGYGTEAIKALVEWVFLQKDIYEISTWVDFEQDAYVKILYKGGFVFRYRDKEKKKERYSIIAPKSSWSGLYLIIGVIVGLMVGAVLGNFAAAIAAGLIIGILVGVILDNKIAEHRAEITGKKDG